MQKKIITLSILIGAVVLGLYFFVVKKNETLPTSTYNLTSYNATTTYTVINMSYPESSESKYPEINAYIKNVKEEFNKDYSSLTASQIKEMYGRQDVEFQLFSNTKIATSSKTTSFIIEVYEYTGGAHGGTTVSTFTYDKAGKLLKLSDVFKGEYLSKISTLAKEYAYKNFADYSQPNMIDPGVAPEADNFSAWYLTDQNIVFIFQQYQIGPYAMGIQEFPLNKAQVSDILNPTYR